VVVLTGGVPGHQDGVERESPGRFHERVRTKAPGHSEMPHHLLVACPDECLDGAALAENLVYVVEDAHVVKLPGVDMIGMQQLQRNLQVLERGIASALLRLTGDEDLIT